MLGEILTIVSGASSVGLVVFLLLIIFYAPANEWLRKRFEKQLQRERIQLGLAADYYQRRLDAYMEIWALTNEAVRTVFNASNPGHPASWEQAAQRLEDLKNGFWDRRPLLSILVFGAVTRANTMFHEARDAMQTEAGSSHTARQRWERLKAEVRAIQGQLLAAMSEDLQHAGLSALVEPNPEARKPHSVVSPESTEVEGVRQLIWFVASLGTKLPYVGRSYVLKNFRAPAGTDSAIILKAAVRHGAIRQGTIEDEERGVVATLELARDSSLVNEVLAET